MHYSLLFLFHNAHYHDYVALYHLTWGFCTSNKMWCIRNTLCYRPVTQGQLLITWVLLFYGYWSGMDLPFPRDRAQEWLTSICQAGINVFNLEGTIQTWGQKRFRTFAAFLSYLRIWEMSQYMFFQLLLCSLRTPFNGLGTSWASKQWVPG